MIIISLSCLLALGLPVACWLRVIRVGKLVFFLILEKNLSIISLLGMTITMSLLYVALLCWYIFLLCPIFESFYHERMLYFVKCLFCIYWDNYMFFIFCSINVVYHFYWFVYSETFLHPRDKSHLVIVCDPFNVLLNCNILLRSFASIFIRDFGLQFSFLAVSLSGFGIRLMLDS